MKTRDLKSLSETIASVVDPIDKERAQMLQEGFLNSLTEKARQIASKEMEDENEEEEEDEMEDEGEEDEEKPSNKKKKSKMNEQELLKPSQRFPTYEPKSKPVVKVKPKKLRDYRTKPYPKVTNEDIELAEKAAPGYEDWASDPKVKASFKKQYGKRWKEVMYGHSWNLAKQENKLGIDEDISLEEGVKRMRRLRRAHASGKASREITAAYDKELAKVSASRLRRGGAPKQTVRGFFTDKPTTAAADKAYSKFSKDAMAKASARGKKIFEDEQFDEGYQAKRMRIIRKAIAKKDGQGLKPEVADFMQRSFNRKRRRDETLSDGRGAVGAMETRARRKTAAMKAKLAEALQLDEAVSARGFHLQRDRDTQRGVQVYSRYGAKERRNKINDIKAVLAGDMTKNAFTKKHGIEFSEHPLTKNIIAARERRLAESMQLDEAGYKRLGRIKGAAYKAELASRGADPNTSLEGLVKAAKLKRAAAELTDKVAAGMARRGGATPETVRNAGSRLSKRGKYTLKAGKLATQYDKAMRSFRSMSRVKELTGRGEDKSEKRARQQAQAAFEKKARTGDFGQDNQAALRARSNFEKRFGRLKGK